MDFILDRWIITSKEFGLNCVSDENKNLPVEYVEEEERIRLLRSQNLLEVERTMAALRSIEDAPHFMFRDNCPVEIIQKVLHKTMNGKAKPLLKSLEEQYLFPKFQTICKN